ncbi:MAG: iron uptake porin [Leptolyngbya sp. BL-A-14]
MVYRRFSYLQPRQWITGSLLAASLLPQTAALVAAQTEPSLPNEHQTILAINAEDQVSSVSQLADVKPTDWAFQALQALVERYGCIVGYPDQRFRGNRELTRYEFAAGVNACLDRLSEFIAASTAALVRKEDLATLQRLQTEFSAELTTLRGRVDSLEARTAALESQQFSTTTKLAGQVIFGVNAGRFSGDRIIDPTGTEITRQQPNATFLYRAALDLNTSFNGTDLLKLRLDTVSDLGRDNAAGFLEPNFGSVLEYTIRGTPSGQLGLSRLYYNFNPLKDVTVSVGPKLVITDYIDLNSYASGIVDFSTYSLVNNLLLFPVNGPSAGAVVDWHPGQGPLKLRALYAAADGANPDRTNRGFVPAVFSLGYLLYPKGGGSRGLFGDPYQYSVEAEYSLSRAFAIRIEYSGGKVFDGRFDVFGANLEWAISQGFGIFGRYGYGSYQDTAFGDINPSYWMAGISFRDVLKPGSISGIAVGQPFIESSVGKATQTNIEAFYNYPLNDNIRITPLIQVITNPSNQSSNGTIVVGSLRTIFSF